MIVTSGRGPSRTVSILESVRRSPDGTALGQRIQAPAAATVTAPTSTDSRPDRGRGSGVIAGIVGLLLASLGVTQVIQVAVNEAWDAPNKNRPAFVVRVVRGHGMLAFFGLGVIGTTALTTPAP
jgi:uncharacterized BrkB/YihY/UPF0761 family membrane protein